MPCSDSNWSDADYVRVETRIKVNKLTRMLCFVCEMTDVSTLPDIITNSSTFSTELREVKEWWEQHQTEEGHEA